MAKTMEILDGNQAAASVTYRVCDYVGVPDAENVIVLMTCGVGGARGGDDQ